MNEAAFEVNMTVNNQPKKGQSGTQTPVAGHKTSLLFKIVKGIIYGSVIQVSVMLPFMPLGFQSYCEHRSDPVAAAMKGATMGYCLEQLAMPGWRSIPSFVKKGVESYAIWTGGTGATLGFGATHFFDMALSSGEKFILNRYKVRFGELTPPTPQKNGIPAHPEKVTP
jgi:hypothetical protein